MKKASLLTFCLVLVCFLAAGPAGFTKAAAFAKEEKKPPEVLFDDSLIHLKDASEISTDAQFITLLDRCGLNSGIKAPARMRAFLTSLPVAKMSIGVGYLYSIRRNTFLWSTGECFLTGYREQVLQKMLSLLKGLGFRESGKNSVSADAMTFTGEENGIDHTVAITRPAESFSGGATLSMIKILWKTADSNTSTMPTLSRLITLYPFFKDRRIEDSVYAEVGPMEVEMVTMGGSSEKGFDWDVTVNPPAKAKAGAMAAQMRAMVEKLGYSLVGTAQNAEVFSRKSTGSTAYVTKITGTEKVNVRFVPEKKQ
ncbi:MAG: hypothetical protein RDV48_15355 [Candidatus Eremiobacteraeota bacterium]|nr:hypothetical protein [Candidatus Eremiobacteraeota bacterium]